MRMHLSMDINGTTRQVEVDPDRTLLSVLRDDLGLTGAKYGCGEGRCGACTVLMDGEPVQTCSISAGAAEGSHLTTIEGLAEGDTLHPLQAAFVEHGALQCGYCTPGMIMSAVALLHANPQPTTAEILQAMQDNICRCGSYPRILTAIQAAGEQIAGGADVTGTVSAAIAAAVAPPVGPQPATAGEPLPAALEAGLSEGLFVAYPCPDLAAVRYPEEDVPAPPPAERALLDIGPWIHLSGDGGITAYVGKVEAGQNMRTSLAQIVAEELRVPVDAVRVVVGDTGRTPFDMGTFGSRTTPITGAQLWRTGATARGLLLDLAAAAWGVERDSLELADGQVRDRASGREASYSDLARDRQMLRVVPVLDEEDAGEASTPATAWTVAGQSVAKLDAQGFVTGEHRYASDQALSGLLHGKVLRPPAFNATAATVDISAAEAMEGVTVVHEDDFIAVAAPDELTATQAIDAIRVRWRTELQVSQPEIFDYFKANPMELEGRRGPQLFVEGSIDAGLAAAHLTHQARYTVDYIAHTPLEPRAALAQWTDAGLTVWTGTQRPFGVRTELVEAFGLAESQVRVIVPDTGAGYGGKHYGDAAIEAARLAKVAGKPVKVVWTRQEEFTWAYFRPGGLIEITSGVDADGRMTALELHNYNSGAAGIQTLYDIPNHHSEYHPTESPLRQGAYRALSSTANHFARESHMDEVAHQLALDPLEIRRRNLRDSRLLAVLEVAADRFGWGQRTPEAHHGFGLACGFEKGSYVAACVEVVVNPANRQPKVLRVVEAFDCGAVLNPDNLRSQIEGAIIQGLGGALFEGIKFANGRILNASFGGYRVPRFGDVPQIETVIIDRKDEPSAGAGETPIIAIAPAVGNAIFQATGVRVRSMPLAPHGVPRAL